MVNIIEKTAPEKITQAVEALVPPDLSDTMKKLEPYSPLPQLFTKVIKMMELTLNAGAASILLFHDNDEELYFEGASGPVGRTLRQVKLNTQYGIAGQVARTGKPLIVNDVARSKNFHKMIDDTTGFTTQSLVCAPLSVNKKILGVIEVLNKRDGTMFDERDLEAVVSVANTAAMAIDSTRLYQTTMDAFRNTILAAGKAVDSKGPYREGHSLRVTEYAQKAGMVLSFTMEEMETLEFASILHDVGKIMIDMPLINKSDDLTPKEWEIMRAHPVNGSAMIAGIPILSKASELVMYHHERFDGRGYPEGLKGEDIPVGARIIAVANEFDAMTNESAFRNVMSIDDAVKELRENAGTQFCPVAVKALVSGLRLTPGKK